MARALSCSRSQTSSVSLLSESKLLREIRQRRHLFRSLCSGDVPPMVRQHPKPKVVQTAQANSLPPYRLYRDPDRPAKQCFFNTVSLISAASLTKDGILVFARILSDSLLLPHEPVAAVRIG